MKYLWRRRPRWRAGRCRSRSLSRVGLGPAPCRVTTPGRLSSFGSPMASRTSGAIDLALAAHDAVDGAARVVEELGRDEGRAVPAHEHEGRAAPGLGLLGEVHHLRDVGEVVHREAHRLRRERLDLAPVVGVLEDLQVEQPHLVAGRLDGRGHALEAEWLEPQVQLRIHQGTRMHQEHSHRSHLPARIFTQHTATERGPPLVLLARCCAKSAPRRKNYRFRCNAYTTSVSALTRRGSTWIGSNFAN